MILFHLNNDLPTFSHQFAYTKSISTNDALVKYTSDITRDLDDKNTVAVKALLLDFSKAFYQMRPDYSMLKLLHLGVRPSLIQGMKSFLTDLQQRVKYCDNFSTYVPSQAGVPQRTILGPV